MKCIILLLLGLLPIFQAEDVKITALDTTVAGSEASNTLSTLTIEAEKVDGIVSDAEIIKAPSRDPANEDIIHREITIGAPQAIADAIINYIYSGELDETGMSNVEAAGLSHNFIKHLAHLVQNEIDSSHGLSMDTILEDMKRLRELGTDRSEIIWAASERTRILKLGLRGFTPKEEHLKISNAILTAVRSYDGEEASDAPHVEVLRNLLTNAVDGALQN